MNVFFFNDNKSLKSYAKYETGSNQIFISQKNVDTLRAGTLSHEIGHAFGITGSVTSTAVKFIGSAGNNLVTNSIDNITSDIQIETANLWLRNGLAKYGTDWVDDYRTESVKTLLNAW
jgi:Zn-dependent peptidase ImmA (M78 family)